VISLLVALYSGQRFAGSIWPALVAEAFQSTRVAAGWLQSSSGGNIEPAPFVVIQIAASLIL
jgi:hypothetical protein